MKKNRKLNPLKKIILMLFVLLSFNIYSEENFYENKYQSGVDYIEVYDPWEGFNRRVYIFNYYADKYFLIPVVDTYRFLTPNSLERGVSNFFKNSSNVSVIVNSAAQGKIKTFMESLGRFSMNTILGVLGIFDVADELEMPHHHEDLGTTLAHYGTPNGPYIVLPLLGPSNLKNTVGFVGDSIIVKEVHPYTNLDIVEMSSIEITALNAVNTRSNLNFRYYETGTPFEYEYVRFIYTKYREFLEKE